MAIVKVYMSETEKEILSSLALSFGLSLSQYVKHELGDIRPEDISIENNNSSSKRTISIRIRVTPEEYDLIKNKAAERPLSSYGRKMMLTGGHPVRISIYTDDITAFDLEVSEKLQHFQNVIDALAYRSVLQEQESEKLLSLLSEIRDDMKKMTHYVKNNHMVTL